MLAKLKEQLFGMKKAAGVEAQLQPEGMVFNFVVLEKVNNLITVVQKAEGIPDLQELEKALPKDIPIALTVSGRGIINRKLPEGTYQNDPEILSLIFPNARQEDFYLQKHHSAKHLFVSVVRRSTVDDLIRRLVAAGYPLLQVSAGPFGVQALLPFLDQKLETIRFNHHTFTIGEEGLEDFAASEGVEEPVQIGEEKVKASLLSSYAASLALFLHGGREDVLETSLLGLQKEEFRYKSLFRALGYGVLGFFVLLLLVNYLVYTYYKDDNARLSSMSAGYQQTLEDVKMLEKKIQEKEYFMRKSGWLAAPKTSFFSDEIASSVPVSSIKLSAIKVNPLNEKLTKREKKEIFQSDTIVVSGVCSNPTALNPWMNGLKEKEWVKSLSHLNYTYDPKTGSGNFEVEIRITDEF